MSKANIFMWRYFLPVKESSLYEISSCTGNFILYRKFLLEINAYQHEKRLDVTWNFSQAPGTGNFLLWQEICSWDKNFLPVTRNLFLLQKSFLWPAISYYGKKFLPVAKYFLLRKIHVCDNAWISANILCESEDFVGAWLPNSRGISHPGPRSDSHSRYMLWVWPLDSSNLKL